jgi:hypothetical protein
LDEAGSPIIFAPYPPPPLSRNFGYWTDSPYKVVLSATEKRLAITQEEFETAWNILAARPENNRLDSLYPLLAPARDCTNFTAQSV